MSQRTVYKILSVPLFAIALVTAACSGNNTPAANQQTEAAVKDTADPDVIARVGDQNIGFSQLNTMLNSSAMVGLSVPALGTPERNTVIMTLLDKAISANLIYLDAQQKGTDRLTSYTEDVHRFEDAIIGALYKSEVLIGDIQVSDAEILHHYNTQTNKDGELTDDLKLAIASMIRKKRLDEIRANMRQRIRENVDVVINDKVLNPDYDDKRSDADVVATYDSHRVTWSQVKELMRGADRRADLAAFYIDNYDERLKRLEGYIDSVILAVKGREAGLEDNPAFIKRVSEYRKTRLINEHRNGLIHAWNPNEDELQRYFIDHMDKIVIPEMRKIQMVVVETEEQAQSIKQQIDANEITMYQAAKQHSIDPNAKRTLGEMGWVGQGTGFEGLDEFTFNLEPDEVGGPVQSPAGWHLVKVLDVTDAQFENLDDPQTRQRTFRAYMQDRFSDYVIDLRQNHFDVAVYDEVLNGHFQREANYVAELSQKARQQGSITEQRIEDMQQWMSPAQE